jgi:aconitate hydratase
MGVLPLQFSEGKSAESYHLDGSETYDLIGLSGNLTPRQDLMLQVKRKNGESLQIPVRSRIDTPIEVEYYKHGGILTYVLRQLIAS